jgi:hypothetical protein
MTQEEIEYAIKNKIAVVYLDHYLAIPSHIDSDGSILVDEYCHYFKEMYYMTGNFGRDLKKIEFATEEQIEKAIFLRHNISLDNLYKPQVELYPIY